MKNTLKNPQQAGLALTSSNLSANVQRALDAIRTERNNNKANTNNNMVNAYQNGINQGLWLAEQFLNTWLAEFVQPVAQVQPEVKALPASTAGQDGLLVVDWATVKGSAHAGFNYKFEKPAAGIN